MSFNILTLIGFWVTGWKSEEMRKHQTEYWETPVE